MNYSTDLKKALLVELSQRSKGSSIFHTLISGMYFLFTFLFYGFDSILFILWLLIAVVSMTRLYVFSYDFKNWIDGTTLEYLNKKHDLFTTLIFSVSIFWCLFLLYPCLIMKIPVFKSAIFYFITLGLLTAANYGLGISKRDFYLFSVPIFLSALVLNYSLNSAQFSDFFISTASVLLFGGFLIVQLKKNLVLWDEYNIKKLDMKLILESLPGAVSLIQNQKYLYLNKKVKQIIGENIEISESDTFGAHHFNPHFIKTINDFEQGTRDLIEFEENLYTSQGERCFKVTVKRLQDNKILILSQDIQDQKINEKYLEDQRIKLVESSKMASLGQMSSGIAHEVNNPLTIILGSLRILQKKSESLTLDFKPDFDNHLKKIETMTLRITKIIRGLRFFAREGTHDPMQTASVRSIVEDTLFISENRFKNSSIEIRKKIDNDFIISCRAVQISQVLLNVLNNAFDAIQDKKNKQLNTNSISESHLEGAEVTNDYIEINVFENLDSKKLVISIKDSGLGVPESVKNKIMEPFFTTKETGKGTGLGLSISRSIMEEHQGRIYFNFDSKDTEVILEFSNYFLAEMAA